MLLGWAGSLVPVVIPGETELNWSQITRAGASRLPRISRDRWAPQLSRSSTEINDWVCALSRSALSQTHATTHGPWSKAGWGEPELQTGFPEAACGCREEGANAARHCPHAPDTTKRHSGHQARAVSQRPLPDLRWHLLAPWVSSWLWRPRGSTLQRQGMSPPGNTLESKPLSARVIAFHDHSQLRTLLAN